MKPPRNTSSEQEAVPEKLQGIRQLVYEAELVKQTFELLSNTFVIIDLMFWFVLGLYILPLVSSYSVQRISNFSDNQIKNSLYLSNNRTYSIHFARPALPFVIVWPYQRDS